MWRQTPQFRKLNYLRVEVRSARLIPVRSEWPEEARWIFDLFIESPAAEGLKALYTPRFIVASRGKTEMLYTTWGTGGWERSMQPWLDKHVGV